LIERFAAVDQCIADLPKLRQAVVELALGRIEVALWGPNRGHLTDLLKEIEDKVDQPPA
jgi:hypothetical protein